MSDTGELSWREKARVLLRVARYRPIFTFGLVFFGAFVAVFEGIGLGFIYPIIEVAQAKEPIAQGGPVLNAFLSTYEFFNIPFTLGYLIIGVAIVMTFRFSISFLVAWLKIILQKQYEKDLRTKAFGGALDAEIGYFDEEGSDDVLNAIITETRYSGRVINRGVRTMEITFLVLMYLAVMFYITPTMTLLAIVLLGGITIMLRMVIEPAVTVGTRVAEANERVQRAVQAGTQGIRDVKLFGLTEEVFSEFRESIDEYVDSEIDLSRNNEAINNFYRLSAALTLFFLIYFGFVFTGLSLGELGVFLIAMFQLAPRVSSLNSQFYRLEGDLSHLVRTHSFLDELSERQESDGNRPVPSIEHTMFDKVSFSYNDEEQVLQGISFRVKKGEFVAFVGPSGAGKSTIVGLFAQLYEPNQGEIRANGIPIRKFNLNQWRERIAIVRQQPFIFNNTLENNITIGKRDASRSEVEQVCEIAKVDEFFDDLPNGFNTKLGDDGVRLSGGQRQRVALARALLKDADLLILDEATSDLDSNLEKQVQRSIERMDRDYAIIGIAHRLSTVRNADRIYTVDGGEIIESGDHQELIENNGQYAELYAIQSQKGVTK